MVKASKKPKILVEKTAEDARSTASELFQTIICDVVDKFGVCTMALSGGTTPRYLYQDLASQVTQGKVPWNKVEIFFGDERDVPLDNIESNYLMAQRALLDHIPVEPNRIHPMRCDVENLQEAADEYENSIRQIVQTGPGGIPQFDLILLGMGGDGHIASLFPTTKALEEKKRLVVSQFVPVLGRRRMTFTYPLINAARNIILLVTGVDKAEAIERLLGDGEKAKKDLPAAGISPQHGELVIILDQAAAKRSGLKS